MRRALAFALAALALAVPVADANVLVIGLDGTRWDKLQAVVAAGRAPNLARLMRRGIGAPTQLAYAPPAAFTVSEVGWSTIASGVNPAKHKVTGPLNMDTDQQTKNGHPDFLSRIEELAPRTDTFAVTDWGNLGLHQSGGPIFSDAIDTKHATAAADTVASYDAEDQADADAAVRILTDDHQDAGFVYFGLVDEVAHAQGSATDAYTDAIAATDRRVGQVLAAARGWTVIVTTDHGQQDLPVGSPLSHGGASTLERTSFVIAAGPGIAPDPRLARARVVDVHPTVLARVGLPGAADLDGVPFATSTIEDATSFYGRQSARRAVQLRLSRAAARRRAVATRRA
jgi:arylsulfatase A-like enzyme